MKIKHITPRIKLLPCRYCGRAPKRKIKAEWNGTSIEVMDIIKCEHCEENFSLNGGSFGYKSETVFTNPSEIFWNEQQRKAEKNENISLYD